MKENLQCAIREIADALNQGSIYVVQEMFNKFREVINEGGTVYIYDELQAPLNYRRQVVFTTIDELEQWINDYYPYVEDNEDKEG